MGKFWRELITCRNVPVIFFGPFRIVTYPQKSAIEI